MAHVQIIDTHGIGRLWDRFKQGFYRAIGNGTMPDALMLPPMVRDDDTEPD